MKRNIYCCYAPVEPHQQPHHSFIFIFFFSLFKLFFPLISKKKKTFFLPISSHTYYYMSFNIFLSFMSLYLSTTLPLYFLLLFLYLDSSFTHFILYKCDIIFFIQSIFFPHKTVSSLSLSLSEFLFFLITLINVDIFFLICVLVSCFFFFFLNMPSISLLFPFYSFG